MVRGRLGTLAIDPERIPELRRKAGVAPGERLRIAYLPGPSGAENGFREWLEGQLDPRFPSIDYPPQMFDLAEALDAEVLVTTQNPDAPGQCNDDSTTFLHFPLAPLNASWVRRVTSVVRATRGLVDRINAFEPHFTVVAANTNWFAMRSIRSRVILSLHCNFWRADSDRPAVVEALRAADVAFAAKTFLAGAVSVSGLGAQQLGKIGGASVPRFSCCLQSPLEAPEPVAPFPTTPRILFVGRMIEEKGVFDLFEAWQQLRQRHPALELTFVGGGPAAAAIAEMADPADLDGPLRLTDRLPREPLVREIRAASILACPTRSSHTEGQPRTILEGHMEGRPAVASAACDTLAAPSTLFHRTEDAGDLARALEEALFDPQVRDRLRDAASRDRGRYHDRAESWGSKVFEAMLAAKRPD